MRIFSFLLFITLFLFGSFLVKATVINDEISKKYSQIFSQNILNDTDINKGHQLNLGKVLCFHFLKTPSSNCEYLAGFDGSLAE